MRRYIQRAVVSITAFAVLSCSGAALEAVGSSPPLVSQLPGAEAKEMLDAIEETSRVTDSPDTLVRQFMFAFTHRNGPQVLMYMAEPLRREWLAYMHPTWMFGVSSPWFEGFEVTGSRPVGDKSSVYDVSVTTGIIGKPGERLHSQFPLQVTVSRTESGWYLVDKITGYPPYR